MRGPRVITLSTDFGGLYAAQVKAALVRLAPSARVVELTNELPAHAIRESAWLLTHLLREFPAGAIHLAVVDPGVGGRRAPLVIRCAGGTHLVGPDNGLLAPIAAQLGDPTAYRIDRDRVPGPPHPSRTFDGRDLFAPAAALLAQGRSARSIGTPTSFRPLHLAPPRLRGTRWRGEVVHTDRFGDVITNLPSDRVGSGAALWVRVGTARGRRLRHVAAYEQLRPGELGLLGSSFGTLEISAREASAARRLRAAVGDAVEMVTDPPPSK